MQEGEKKAVVERIGFQIQKSLLRDVKVYCVENDITLSDLVRKCIQEVCVEENKCDI